MRAHALVRLARLLAEQLQHHRQRLAGIHVVVDDQHALARLLGLPYFPLTPTFPHFGPLGMFAYLPAKFTIRFLEPVRTDQMGDEPWEDKGLVQTVAHEVRTRIQENLIDMLAERRSVWFG